MKYEIWLGNDSTHFDHGIALFDDGCKKPLGAFCNISIRQDSLLVGTTDENGELNDKLRWYPMPGVIDFYIWSKDLEYLIFHNSSDHDIYITGYSYLKPGETAEIRNCLGRKHSFWLRQMRPVGLGRLIETTHTEDDYLKLIGKFGLILSRMSRQDPSKTVMRFVLADCLRDAELDLEGLETSAGVLKYEEDGRLVLQTKKSRYVFAYDNGDNV